MDGCLSKNNTITTYVFSKEQRQVMPYIYYYIAQNLDKEIAIVIRPLKSNQINLPTWSHDT
jgi:hypothetical protein